jgi:hypothetical protein
MRLSLFQMIPLPSEDAPHFAMEVRSRSVQPSAIMGSNTHGLSFPVGDFLAFVDLIYR